MSCATASATSRYSGARSSYSRRNAGLVSRERPLGRSPNPLPGRVDVDVDQHDEGAPQQLPRLGARHGAAAEGDHQRVWRRQRNPRRVALDLPEGALAALLEELRDRLPRPLLDRAVEVEELAPEPHRRVAAERRLSGAHEADEDDVPAEGVEVAQRASYALEVGAVGGGEVADRVAAELVVREHGQLPGDGGLGHDRERLDRAHVGALDERRGRLTGREIDRTERLHQRRQRLHPRADDDLLAVRDPGLDPAGAVRLPASIDPDLVVRLRPELVREREALADLDPLHRLDPHQRGGEARVEAVVLRRVAAEPGRDVARAYLDDPADRVARGTGLVDAGAKALLVDGGAGDLDPDRAQQRLRDRARGDVHRRVPRRGALERVPDVVEVVLLDTGEVGVAGARKRHGLRALSLRLALRRPRAHPPRPVLVVAVPDDERQRRPERAAVAQAGQHLDAVLLDLLPRRAAVALLAPLQVGVDRVAVEHEPGREAGEDRDEPRAVRLARSGKPK